MRESRSREKEYQMGSYRFPVRLEAGLRVKWREKEKAMPAIIINQKTYNRLEDMPAHERQAYEQMMQIFVDENGNGIPDFMEGDMVQNVFSAYSTKVAVNGKTVHGIDDLTPEARQSVESAFKLLTSMGILPSTPATQIPQISREPQFASKPLTPPSSSVVQEDKASSVFTWVIVGMVLCFGLATAAIAVTYFMS
jgi:hypothetical protein